MRFIGLSTSLCLLTLAFAACDESSAAPADSGADAGPYDGDGESCEPAPVGSPMVVTLGQHSRAAAWIAADGELLGVGPLAADGGYEITRIKENGEQRDPWMAQAVSTVDSELSLAAMGGVLAIADLTIQKEPDGNHRRQCRLSLLRMADQSVVRANIRVSDPPDGGSVLNEAKSCKLTATDVGVVVAWQQYTSREGDAALFAQRFELDGMPRGERLALRENILDKEADLALTSDGESALIAFRAAKESVTTLAFIGPDSIRTQPLEGVDTPIRTFAPAHAGFLLRTSSNMYQLDRNGRVLHGPHGLGLSTLVAPLGDGYVTIDKEEYLVARTLDSTMAKRSAPLGISDDRGAGATAVLPLASGDALLIFGDRESSKLVRLGCGKEPGPLGPRACPKAADLQPLDIGCGSDEVCHIVLRLDYLTLGVRGWSVSSAPAASIDAAGAEQAAQDVFDANSDYLMNPLEISGPAAGLYAVHHPPSDFGGFALVSHASGVVVAAGGIVWSGRGGYWVPNAWRPAADIGCDEAPTTPSEQVLDGETCPGDGPPGSTAAQAMSLALSTNAARALAEQGEFTARTYLYTPSVGACSPEVAEWLVILSRE